MQVKILGGHQGSSREIGFMSLLIDGRLVIDAGGLSAGLNLEEQEQVEAVLITHKHYDHTRDLPGFVHGLWQIKSLHVHCLDDTRAALQDYYFNGVIWPRMVEMPPGYYPLIFHKVEPEQPFNLLGYAVTPVTVAHTVPTVGYLVEIEGKSVFYTADTRSEEDPLWTRLRPDLLIAETTMASEYDDVAGQFGHMTPLGLERVLRIFQEKQGYYPRTICVHINPAHEERIGRELAELSERLGADIAPGCEGMVLEI
ncbi:MAG TPA: MBL fold metallo-hydrolase [Chloroflexia bacterium]|nr:MBL fold metallo-hydrolase [Chloroflexia bacterium]